jgi:transcriptional regulator with XRE-family HTH domain
MDFKGVNTAQIAANIGISQRMVEFYISGDKGPSYKNLVKLSRYLGFDMAELSVRDTKSEEPTVPYHTKRLAKKNGTHTHVYEKECEGLPIYDVPIDASFLERFRDQAYYEPIGFLNIPKLRNCNFAAIISGNSMYPMMKSGTIAACRIVEQLDYFDEGEMYFISTVNGFES